MEIDRNRCGQIDVSYRNDCITMTSKRVGEKIDYSKEELECIVTSHSP